MTLKEALGFKLPNGKTIGEASAEDWQNAADIYRAEQEAADELDPARMTSEDRQRIQASIDRSRAFDAAIRVVKQHLQKRGQRTW